MNVTETNITPRWRINFYCQYCDREEFSFRAKYFPLSFCPFCLSFDEDAIWWQGLTDPICPKCDNQNVQFEEEAMIDLNVAPFPAKYEASIFYCPKCDYSFGIPNQWLD